MLMGCNLLHEPILMSQNNAHAHMNEDEYMGRTATGYGPGEPR